MSGARNTRPSERSEHLDAVVLGILEVHRPRVAVADRREPARAAVGLDALGHHPHGVGVAGCVKVSDQLTNVPVSAPALS